MYKNKKFYLKTDVISTEFKCYKNSRDFCYKLGKNVGILGWKMKQKMHSGCYKIIYWNNIFIEIKVKWTHNNLLLIFK